MYINGHPPVPTMIGTLNLGVGDRLAFFAVGLLASASASAVVLYYPLVLPSPVTVRRVWWINGATTTGGATIEVGIYASTASAPTTKLVSGSATQGTATQVQFVDVTDTVLSPGLYWQAIVASTATSTTLFRAGGSANWDIAYLMQEAGTSLPTTASPVTAASNYIYAFGFATTASP